ncbi:hypothetical protein K488DRAFT_41425 [Vararia minispora EC-137]|uniref:Uncharacterized protein n=1 Tax=Vararia minispora EC-137 TaxID=1314806 RepID=A0ACB8QWU3_9AGAM|nr:hypothetical protein K488DRAFT_41425 [Vararia minispora EC-137]
MIAESLATLAARFPNSNSLIAHLVLLLPGSSTAPYLSPAFCLGAVLTILGASLRFACFRALGTNFTYELAIRDKHKLITSGPYSIVRHPAYMGTMLVAVGATLAELSPGSWWTEANVMDTGFGRVAAVLWVVGLLVRVSLLLRAPKEDAMLREHFGKEWEEYAQRVRWWYVPGVI